MVRLTVRTCPLGLKIYTERMRIGIDAKWYFTGPVSTQVVLQNLLPELFSAFPGHEWIIFLDKKDRQLDFPHQAKNIRVEYVWADNNMLSNVFVLPRYVRRLKPDVMVYQTFPGLHGGTGSVAFIHDVLFRDFPQFFSWKERLYFLPLAPLTRRASRVVATTGYVAERLVKHHYVHNRSQVDLVPLGVNPVYGPASRHDKAWLEQVRHKFRLPGRYLLYVGRLNVRKNIENLLRSLPLLNDTAIPLVIAGKEDSVAPDLERLLADTRIRERIILTGGMSNEELVATYAMAHVFCFPSLAEGFGLPPLEAMASGIPVVVSNTTSLPEVCGDAAVYIDPSSPAGIAAGLNSLLDNPSLYEEKKKQGLRRVDSFPWKDSAEALMQSIANAANKKL